MIERKNGMDPEMERGEPAQHGYAGEPPQEGARLPFPLAAGLRREQGGGRPGGLT